MLKKTFKKNYQRSHRRKNYNYTSKRFFVSVNYEPKPDEYRINNHKKRDSFGVLEDFLGDALEGSVGFTLIFMPRLLRLPRLRNRLGNGRRNPKPIPKR